MKKNKEKNKKKLSELDQKIWAIVNFDAVVCKDKTYAQCVTMYEKENLNSNEAVIVTNEAAERMTQAQQKQ